MPYYLPHVVVKDEGTQQGIANTLNFTGAGVSATVSGSTATVNIAGGGSLTVTNIEVDLGAPSFAGRFIITDAGITALSVLLVWQAPGPYTGKGNNADEAAMAPVQIIAAIPDVGAAVIHWQTPPMIVAVPLRANGLSGGANTSTALSLSSLGPNDIVENRRVGLVNGNVKFNYVIL
jgi:hypothetical protein